MKPKTKPRTTKPDPTIVAVIERLAPLIEAHLRHETAHSATRAEIRVRELALAAAELDLRVQQHTMRAAEVEVELAERRQRLAERQAATAAAVAHD